MSQYNQLKELALANADKLFSFWGLDYIQINKNEYDFRNPTRQDRNFGACRFNIEKGVGADFAGHNFTKEDFNKVGLDFTKEDFDYIHEAKQTNWGFDIIGLTQRLYSCNNYKTAAEFLRCQLQNLSKKEILITPNTDAHIKRKEKQLENQLLKVQYAKKTWEISAPIDNTLAEKYLHSRDIKLSDKDKEVLKFHPKIMNKEVGKTLPCLLLKVQKTPGGPLEAIHRIYLDENGNKANVNQPKMALGSIKGLGIWFGEPGIKLWVGEGSEEALSIRTMNRPFAVSTINATNFHNLTIPDYVKEIILCPNSDEAGKQSCQKALRSYKLKGRKIKVAMPPIGKDFNDLLRENYDQ